MNMATSQMTRSYNVLLLDTKKNNCNHYIVLSIYDALKNSPRVNSVKKVDYRNAVSEAATGKYNLFLAVDAEEVETSVCSRISGLVDASVLWSMEDPYERHVISRYRDIFDILLTNDEGSTNFYYPPAQHMPLAAGKRFNYFPVRENEEDFAYDVYFIGTAWPNRVRFLQSLLSRLPDLRYKITLQYNPYLPPLHLDRPLSSYIGAVPNRQFCQYANRSRITLCLHRDFAGSLRNSRATTPGPRLFETALAGGFQLADREFVDLEQYFQEGREIAVYETLDECEEKIRYYLEHSEERRQIAQAAQQTTLKRHLYDHRIAQILDQVDQLNSRHVTLPSKDAVNKRLPRLLFVTHNILQLGHWGGVEVYQDILARSMQSKYEIFIYRYAGIVNDNNGEPCKKYVLTDAGHKILEQIVVPMFDDSFDLTNQRLENSFGDMMVRWRIDIIHYQNLINHPVSLPIISKMLGIPSVFTIHDFYMVCKRFNLLDYLNKFCDPTSRRLEDCDICLNAAEHLSPGSQTIRRTFMSRVLDCFDKIIGNSPSAAKILMENYPEMREKNNIVQLGALMPPSTSMLGKTLKKSTQTNYFNDGDKDETPLKVVFLGTYTQIKGGDIFLHAVNQLRDEPIEFHIFGRVDPPFTELLPALNLKNVIVHGPYTPGQLMIDDMDLSLHLSLWPETYCITLSEAWSRGVAPIVTQIGALADRVQDGVNGFIIPVGGAGELVKLLRHLAYDREALDRVRANITEDLWVTADAHTESLQAVYSELLQQSATPRDVAPIDFQHTGGLSVAIARMALATNQWNRRDALTPSSPFVPKTVSFLSTRPPQPLPVCKPDIQGKMIVRQINSIDLDISQSQWIELAPSQQLVCSGWTISTNPKPWKGILFLCLTSYNTGTQLFAPCTDAVSKNHELFHNSHGTDFQISCQFSQPDINDLFHIMLIEISEGVALTRSSNCYVVVRDGQAVEIMSEPIEQGSAPMQHQLPPYLMKYPVVEGYADGNIDFIHAAFVKNPGTTPAISDGGVVRALSTGYPTGPVSLEIKGWVIDEHLQEVWDDVIVMLEGPETLYATTVRVNRPDLAEAKQVPWYLKAGFVCRCWLPEPTLGLYNISVLQVANGRLLKFSSLLQIALGATDTYFVLRDSMLVAVKKPLAADTILPAPESPLSKVDFMDALPVVIDKERVRGYMDMVATCGAAQSGPRTEEVVVLRSSHKNANPPVLYVKGWAVDGKITTVHPEVYISLTSSETFLFKVMRSSRPDLPAVFGVQGYVDGGFIGLLNLSELPVGDYTLAIIQASSLERLTLPTTWRIVIHDEDQDDVNND